MDNKEHTPDVLSGLLRNLESLRDFQMGFPEFAIPVSETALTRADLLLRIYEKHSIEKFGRSIIPPHIGPGPGGGIDLHWCDEFELLINIPADSEQINFYGDDVTLEAVRNAQTKGLDLPKPTKYIKGKCVIDINDDIASLISGQGWLK